MRGQEFNEEATFGVVAEALRNVRRRARRPLYEPTWTSRHFAWLGDLVARLDPAPIARWWRGFAEPVTDALDRAIIPLARGLSRLAGDGHLARTLDALGQRGGLLLVPVARVLDRAGEGSRAVLGAAWRSFDLVLTRIPMPVRLRRGLWIPPFQLLTPDEAPAEARLRGAYGSVLWVSITVSAGLHFLAFMLSPAFRIEDVSFQVTELAAVEIPPDVEIPPPPQAIPRPATPVISDIPLAEDVTIAATTFADNPVDRLPPPPVARSLSAEQEGEVERRPTFTPFTVAPEIRNRSELERLVTEFYPRTLRDAAIGGVVVVWFYIDAEGRVTATRVAQSSGYPQLDSAALAVSDLFVFSPALNNDQRVPVWVQFPITFAVR